MLLPKEVARFGSSAEAREIRTPAGLGVSARWLDCGLDGAHDSQTKAGRRGAPKHPDDPDYNPGPLEARIRATTSNNISDPDSLGAKFGS